MTVKEMKDIYLTNSLSRRKEIFKAINPPSVGMYTCGPTVYDYQHIGNFRTMVLSDILQRVLKFNGYKIKSVRNITDIDDKTIKGASNKDLSLEIFTKDYTDKFFDDLEKINILSVDKNTKATDYIKEMISYISFFLDKGLAYKEKDGSVYFDISKFRDYGKLSRVKKRSLKAGTRVLSDEYSKDDVGDFALWKSVKPNQIGYDSPWGKGRPGWHIECSVMSQSNLGSTFDIHVGGIDLLFPHHENEIAQSEGKTGKKFVNYFIHGEFLLVEGKKMSKSLKNFYTIKDIKQKGFDPLALRYFYLTGHYKNILNFTWEALGAAQTALDKLREHVANLKSNNRRTILSEEKREKYQKFSAEFITAINDDLNTPKALAVLWVVVKSSIPSQDKYDLLILFDKIFGLGLKEIESGKLKVGKEINDLIKKRDKLRKKGKYNQADKMRRDLEKSGYKIEDTSKGAKVKVKK